MRTPVRVDPHAAQTRRESRALDDYSDAILTIERAIRSNRSAGYHDAEIRLEQARVVLMPPGY